MTNCPEMLTLINQMIEQRHLEIKNLKKLKETLEDSQKEKSPKEEANPYVVEDQASMRNTIAVMMIYEQGSMSISSIAKRCGISVGAALECLNHEWFENIGSHTNHIFILTPLGRKSLRENV